MTHARTLKGTACPVCDGTASWGYGYAAGGLGSYLMCDKCMHVLQFDKEEAMTVPTSEASPFWFVWNEQGHAPTHKHVTVESAKAEAERLARANPGERFTVLAALGTCEFDAVKWTQINHDEVPF